MGNTRRLQKNKHRGMYRRLRSGKKPMSEEQKKKNKEAREAQKKKQLEINAKVKTAKEIKADKKE